MRCSLFSTLFLVVLSTLSAEQWLETSTNNFRFVYRSEHEFAVEELVSFADTVYTEVATLFGSDPQTVTAVVYGETDLANGYYNPNPPQHIGLFLVQPSTTWTGSSSESWLRLLLVHELTHFLQANHSPGLFEGLAFVFGSSIAGLDIGLVPLWLTEGLAIHAESTRTSGGRQSDPRYELYERALILENQMFSLKQAGYASHLAPPGRQYVAGSFLLEYMVAHYGEQFIEPFLSDFSAFPLFGMWGPIERATGTPMSEIYRNAIAWLENRYAERKQIPERARVSPAQRGDYYLPVETQEGLYLYRTRPDRRPGIVNWLEDGGEREIVTVALSDPFSWSVTPDGRRLVFATVSSDRTIAGNPPLQSNLYLHDLQTGTTRALTHSGGFFQPRISPDGRSVVAVRRIAGFQELVTVEIDTGLSAVETLLRSPATRYYNPSLSPSGSLLVVAENRLGVQRLTLVHTATGESRALPAPEGTNPEFPRFTDENTVLFTASVDGSLRLFQIDLTELLVSEVGRDRVGIAEATRVAGQIMYRTYSPDGNVLKQLSSPLDRPQAAATRPLPAPPVPAAAVASAPFTPVAWPRYWLPALGFSGGLPNLSFLGAGVTVGGRDLLARTAWLLQALYFPAISQIGYGFTIQTDLGPLLLDTFAEGEYRTTGAIGNPVYVQQFSQGLVATLDLLNDYELGTSRRFGLTAEASTRFAFASLSPFSLTELGSDTVSEEIPLFIPGAGFITSRSPISSRSSAAAPWAMGLRAQAAVPLSLLTGSVETLLVTGRGFVNLHAGGNHVLQLTPQVTYATNSDYSSPFALRGFSGTTATTAPGPGHFKLSASYLPPHLLVDIPLFSSVGITRIGLMAFAEATGGFTRQSFSPELDEAIAGGVAITTVVTYLVDWPVTGGVSLRVRPQSSEPFGRGDVSFFLELDLAGSLAVIDSTLWRRDEKNFQHIDSVGTRLPGSCCE